MKPCTSMTLGIAGLALLPLAALADGDNSSWDGQAASERYTPGGAVTAERALTHDEIREIVARAGVAEENTDIRYLGGPETAIETRICCENLEEQIEMRTEIDETIEYFDAVTRRDITQPIQRILVQPVTREVLQGSVEEITEARVYETIRLEPRYDRDTTPATVETYIPQVTTETREEITESYRDVVTQRQILQPIERTTIVPVQRRIVRPVTENIVNETRYETRTAPVQRETVEIPATIETLTDDVTTINEERVVEEVVPYVAQRNIYQPKTITTVQPIERQILRGRAESITEPTRYEEERLPLRVESEVAPPVVETIIPELTERTVLEVEDVYIDEVTRNVVQPVVVTTIQPVIREVLQTRTETEIRPMRYETETLATRLEPVAVPDTQVEYIPQVTEEYVEEYTESYFEAVTHRDIHQPVVRTIVQPIEVRKVNSVTETVQNPTRYETVRASLVVLNIDRSCNCD